MEPCLSNGYIGTDPSTPWLFIDGIYSGEGTDSHRAAVPSPVFWKPTVDTLHCLKSTILFHFGMGVSMTVQHYPGLELQTSTFISRARPHLLVRVLEALFLSEDEEDATSLKDEVLVLPDRPVDFESPDLQTSVEVVDGRRVHFHGRIWQRENEQCLAECDQVFMLTEITPELATAGIHLTRTNPRVCFLTSISRSSWDEAVEAYEAVIGPNPSHGPVVDFSCSYLDGETMSGFSISTGHPSPNSKPVRPWTSNGDLLFMQLSTLQLVVDTCCPLRWLEIFFRPHVTLTMHGRGQ
ncbi:unnamed protein product [Dibothriocephalus latus]|uniref:Uncharacterized protein n=1 Tax=Dibothriocephalus latus TaxID=60516 RepID=A0A3P7LCN2_DIBLA|nr:unnamed protein product [Dibothriocephalus latus]